MAATAEAVVDTLQEPSGPFPQPIESLSKDGKTATLYDGRELIAVPSPAARNNPSGPAANAVLNAIRMCLLLTRNDAAYLDLLRLKLGVGHKGGRPSHYPTLLLSLMWNLQVAFVSRNTIRAWLELDFIESEVRGRILAARDEAKKARQALDPNLESLDHLIGEILTPAEIDRIDAWERAGFPLPSDSWMSRLFATLRQRGVSTADDVMERGLDLSVCLGRFDPTAPIDSLDSMSIGDGTKPKAASDIKAQQTIDPATGRISQRRYDAAAVHHTEGGGTEVFGTDIVIIWSVGQDKHATVPIGVAFNPSPAPQDEAKVAVSLVEQVQERLACIGRNVGLLSYDRAADADEQERLNNIGAALHTRARGDRLDDESNSHYKRHKHLFTLKGPCGSVYTLSSVYKAMHVMRSVSGAKAVYEPVKSATRSVVRNGRRYIYTDYEFPCAIDEAHTHRVTIPWNGYESFERDRPVGRPPVSTPTLSALPRPTLTRREYHNLLLYLQPIEPSSEVGQRLIGVRQRSELMHSMLDRMLPFQRLQRWSGDEQRSYDAKAGFVHGYLSGLQHVIRSLQGVDADV